MQMKCRTSFLLLWSLCQLLKKILCINTCPRCIHLTPFPSEHVTLNSSLCRNFGYTLTCLHNSAVWIDLSNLCKSMLTAIRPTPPLMYLPALVVFEVGACKSRHSKNHPTQILIRLSCDDFFVETTSILSPLFK